MKNFKISVHIPYYTNGDFKKTLRLKNVCKNYLSLSKNVTIFVHSNKKIKSYNKKIKFITHNLKYQHPYKLTWNCRKLMFLQRNNYDVFIYGEDDIIFSKDNYNYWLKYKNTCNKNNYNLGFLRVEERSKNNLLYSSDQIEKIKYGLAIKKHKFAKLESSFNCLWIYEKKEFKEFTKTKYWNFDFKWITISGVLLIREMSAVGWHGENMSGQYMDRYRATILPIKKGKLLKESFIVHSTNKYANNPSGLHGSIKVKDLLPKKLIKFVKKNFLIKTKERFFFLFYYYTRFNLKKLLKK